MLYWQLDSANSAFVKVNEYVRGIFRKGSVERINNNFSILLKANNNNNFLLLSFICPLQMPSK